MQSLIKKLDIVPGYKTYIIVACGVIVNVLVYLEVIGFEQIQLFNRTLELLGIGTIKMKLDR